jgi:hypothetical protein
LTNESVKVESAPEPGSPEALEKETIVAFRAWLQLSKEAAQKKFERENYNLSKEEIIEKLKARSKYLRACEPKDECSWKINGHTASELDKVAVMLEHIKEYSS